MLTDRRVIIPLQNVSVSPLPIRVGIWRMLRDRRVIIPLQNRFPPANPCRDLTMLKNALFYHYVRFVLKANIISRHTDTERERERERERFLNLWINVFINHDSRPDLITLWLVDVSVAIVIDEAVQLLDSLIAETVFVALRVLLYAGWNTTDTISDNVQVPWCFMSTGHAGVMGKDWQGSCCFFSGSRQRTSHISHQWYKKDCTIKDRTHSYDCQLCSCTVFDGTEFASRSSVEWCGSHQWAVTCSTGVQSFCVWWCGQNAYSTREKCNIYAKFCNECDPWTEQIDWQAKQPSQMACFLEALKCWAWSSTCRYKAKDITPSTAWRREV